MHCDPVLVFALLLFGFMTLLTVIPYAEYRNHTLTRKVFGGNAGAACYFLAAVIFSFGMLRDVL